MDIGPALDFARTNRRGILATNKRDGRPQLSQIMHWVEPEGTIGISVTATRAKTRNAMRDPRVSLHVLSDGFGAYVVIEGDAEVMPPAAEPDDATVEALVRYYRALSGEHPDWDDYRRAMVADQRLLLRIHPTGAYGFLPAGA